MKITCNVIKDMMPGYIDDLCSDDTRKIVEEHIKSCPSCRNMLSDMQKPVLADAALQAEYVKAKTPLKKIKQKHIKDIILTITMTAFVVIIFTFLVQNIAAVHDFLYPKKVVGIREEQDINMCYDLEFDSLLYRKEIVNDANSSGNISVEIYNEAGELLEQFELENGSGRHLNNLKKFQKYKVSISAGKGAYFIYFY